MGSGRKANGAPRGAGLIPPAGATQKRFLVAARAALESSAGDRDRR